MDQQRERARAAQKSGSIMFSTTDTELPVTNDAPKYETDRCESKIIGWIGSEGFRKEGKIDTKADIGIVLEQTCFYAEAGGQVGDIGTIESSKGLFVAEGTEKIANCVVHRGRTTEGSLSVGDTIQAKVSKDRNATKKNHTATHLLQWALQQVCGNNVAQQGSLVCPDYLRFDFTYPKALKTDQTREVEKLVREKIVQDLPINCTVMAKEEAEKVGAMALFGEKYGTEVRVVAIGAEDKSKVSNAFSKEFCGGTHVQQTSAIGGFKITKEESISAGVRRITALTGTGLTEHLEKRSRIGVEKLINDNKKLTKQLKSSGKSEGSDVMAEAKALFEKSEKIEGNHIIVGQVSTASAEQARSAIDMLKKKAKSAAIVLTFEDDGKVTLLAGVTGDLIKKGLKAGDIVKEIAPIVDGGGGGRPEMAQAGGRNPKKIKQALEKASQLIKKKLS
jgi:alanyl-tRNA synthetase